MNKIFFFLLLIITFIHINVFSNELHIGDFEYQEYSVIEKQAITKKGQVFFREGNLNNQAFSVYSIIVPDESSMSQPLLYFEFEEKTLSLFLQSLQKYFDWNAIATRDNDVLTKEIVKISDVAHSFDAYYDWYTTISDISLQFISQYTDENESSVKTWLTLTTNKLFTTRDNSIIFPATMVVLDIDQAKYFLSLFDENKIEETREKDISYKYQ